MKTKVKLIHAECLAAMSKLADQSVDLILCDLPYGTTQNKWDAIIDPVKMWAQYKRICKGAIVLTAAQPFTSVLVCSNLKGFKYQWVWHKSRASGHLNAKKMPMKEHEDILVFYSVQPTYNPQMKTGKPNHVNPSKSTVKGSSNYGTEKSVVENLTDQKYPSTLLPFTVLSPTDPLKTHPTQKPVALMEYMVKTYTNPGMVVLDNCMGSGTTGVACVKTGRHFIGIEQDEAYFNIARQRIQEEHYIED